MNNGLIWWEGYIISPFKGSKRWRILVKVKQPTFHSISLAFNFTKFTPPSTSCAAHPPPLFIVYGSPSQRPKQLLHSTARHQSYLPNFIFRGLTSIPVVISKKFQFYEFLTMVILNLNLNIYILPCSWLSISFGSWFMACVDETIALLQYFRKSCVKSIFGFSFWEDISSGTCMMPHSVYLKMYIFYILKYFLCWFDSD